MSTSISPEPGVEPSVTELVSGIVSDLQNLGIQHLALFRNEIKQDLKTATTGASFLGAGFAVLQVGLILVCLMLVHLLSTQVPTLSLWMCYGIVGAFIVVLGAIAVGIGVNQMKSVEALTPKTAQAMKEDTEWLSTPK
ncbi:MULTISPECIES: phage holin family protein [unclassified Schlesneria]|uniref:phage holin family protein n=1 Tax=Schlesneria TaxID=656899 RepID=UPI002EF0549F